MKRRRELDSLRGLAALSVVLYHTLAANSSSFQTALDLGPASSSAISLLAYSPLHIFWLGAESVFLFFVLSGFVLTRAAMKSSFSWEAYFPSRLVRLFVPMLGAIALTWFVYLIFNHDPSPLNNGMLDGAPTDYPAQMMLYDATVFGGTSTQLGVLWSLQWEITFSLLLPVFVLLSRRHAWSTGVSATIVCLAGWLLNVNVASYLPMFFLGSVLAQNWSRIVEFFDFLRPNRRFSNLWGMVLSLLSISAITSYFLLGRVMISQGLPARLLSIPVVLLGIALLLVVVQQWEPLRWILTRRIFTALGAVSFSLYLVHRPIVIAFAFYFHRGAVATVVGVVVSVAVAIVFYWLVEKPAHRLSRGISAGIRARATLESKASAAVALAGAAEDAKF